ncbi:MAG: MFS transporter [Bacteroidia bacterium]|nr:MFS transporter [Bacteroidia bacterium]
MSHPPLLTRQFWLLALSNFLFSASFQMIIPELPAMLSAMGGKAYIGYLITLFTVTAGLARPFSGKLADRIGRVPIMALGSVTCFVCSLLYPSVHSVTAFLLLRLFHGLSTGTKPTATMAYVADVAPEARRGEAAGLLGIFTAVGMSAGPALGGWLAGVSLQAMFYTSAAFALLSILCLGRLRETLPNPERFRLRMLRIGWQDVYEPRVLGPALVMLLLSFSTGVVLILVPDHSLRIGLTNKGLFFTVYTLASLCVRLFGAKIPDRYGRTPVLLISSAVLAVSLFMLAVSSHPAVFFAAALVYGAAWGLNSPTLTAWTVDLSHPEFRGRAMATLFVALEAGIGLGAWLAGWLYGGLNGPIALLYVLSGLAACAASGYLLWFRIKPRAVRAV